MDGLQKRQAVKYLTNSLLRSQQFLPAVTTSTLIEAERLERPDPDEIKIWIELQQWLRYFAAKSQEKATDSSETTASVRKPTRTRKTAEAKRQSEAVQEAVAAVEEAATQPTKRKVARKERVKRVPSFFERPAEAHSELQASIKEGNHVRAMSLYHDSLRDGQEFETCIIYALFSLLTSKQQPFSAFKVLQHYEKLAPSDDHIKFYERLCNTMRYMDPSKHYYKDIHTLTRSMVKKVLRFDRDGQQSCVPALVSALAMQ